MTSEPEGPQRVTMLGCQHLRPAQIEVVRAQFDPALYDLQVVSTGRPVELSFGSWMASLWYAYRISGKPVQVAAIMDAGCPRVLAYHGHDVRPLTPARENWLRGRRIAGGFDLFKLAVSTRIPGAQVNPYLLRGNELQLIAA
jgi:hypothetical protein